VIGIHWNWSEFITPERIQRHVVTAPAARLGRAGHAVPDRTSLAKPGPEPETRRRAPQFQYVKEPPPANAGGAIT